MDGMNDMNSHEARFRKVEDMSDSQEEDMSIDSGSEDGEQVQPPAKKARLGDDQSLPKWSNPDPYFVLPPVDETAGKKKDIVRIIRKAKASAGGPHTQAANGDDFISFNFGGDGGGDEAEAETSDSDDSSVVEVLPTPKRAKIKDERFSHLDNLHPNRHAPTKSVSHGYDGGDDEMSPPAPGIQNVDVWPPPRQPPTNQQQLDELDRGAMRNGKKRSAAAVEEDDDEVPSRSGRASRKDRKGIPKGLKPEWRAVCP